MRNLLQILFIFFISGLALISSPPVDNPSSISGFIRDSANLETLPGATVSLAGTKYGAFTNKQGYYSINNIPSGKYTLSVTFLGYGKFTKQINLKPNEKIKLDAILSQDNIELNEVQVEAEREIEKREISISKIDIPIKQIKNIRIGGEADVFRSLQYLPGVLTSSQISSGLFVRGGSPDQNLVLVDGAIVYNPSHLFGFISTFNADAIKDVELIKGGFPAEYGGRLSAILDLTQKDGNRNKVEGVASIGALSSRLSLEGPLGNGSWFIGGRRTYLELIKSILPSKLRENIPAFNFYDLNGKITQLFGDNDKVSLSSFISNDALEFNNRGFILNLDVGNQTISSRWNHIFSDNFFADVVASTSYYKNFFFGDQMGWGFEIKNSIRDYSAKANLDWFISEELTTKTGFEFNYYDFFYYANFTGNLDTNVKVGTNEPGLIYEKILDRNYSAFFQTTYNINEVLSVQGGLRLNYWDLSKNLLLDPRIAVRYTLSEYIRLKAAWGMFSQDLRLASQPDFSFFDTWLPTDNTVMPSRAEHYILSMESNIMDEFDINVDVYYKNMHNISEINNNTFRTNDIASLFLIGNSNAYGGEIFLQRKFGKLAGWVGYALGFIEAKFDSINGGNPFRPKYDRRHDFKVVLQYELDKHWAFNTTFIFQTGQSYTGASSQFPIKFPEDDIGRIKIFPTQRYGLRLPPSHQLNISVVYSFKMFGLNSKAILDVNNVYNHRDIWFRFYDTSKPVTEITDVTLLPILPTISLEVNF